MMPVDRVPHAEAEAKNVKLLYMFYPSQDWAIHMSPQKWGSETKPRVGPTAPSLKPTLNIMQFGEQISTGNRWW